MAVMIVTATDYHAHSENRGGGTDIDRRGINHRCGINHGRRLDIDRLLHHDRLLDDHRLLLDDDLLRLCDRRDRLLDHGCGCLNWSLSYDYLLHGSGLVNNDRRWLDDYGRGCHNRCRSHINGGWFKRFGNE
jgi:hypothetical protein